MATKTERCTKRRHDLESDMGHTACSHCGAETSLGKSVREMREKQCLVEGCYRDQGERHEGLCDTHAAEAHDAAQRRETARRIRREKAQQAEQQRDPQRLQRLLRDDAPTAIIDMHIKAVLDEHGFEVVEDVIADAAIECIEHEAAIRRAATSNRFRS